MDFRFKVNDWVVCTREKHSLSPGPRAKNISPSPHGEMYSYEVDKYWIVREITDDTLVLETRTGKKHELPKSDRRLRHPTWWERFFYADRFPSRNPTPPAGDSPPPHSFGSSGSGNNSVSSNNAVSSNTSVASRTA